MPRTPYWHSSIRAAPLHSPETACLSPRSAYTPAIHSNTMPTAPLRQTTGKASVFSPCVRLCVSDRRTEHKHMCETHILDPNRPRSNLMCARVFVRRSSTGGLRNNGDRATRVQSSSNKCHKCRGKLYFFNFGAIPLRAPFAFDIYVGDKRSPKLYSIVVTVRSSICARSSIVCA